MVDGRRYRKPDREYLGFYAKISEPADILLLDKLVKNLRGSTNQFLIHELLRTAVKARPEMFT
jgi:hypothetical protein